MNAWKEFLGSLDSPGGHILLLLVAVAALLAATACGLQSAEKFLGEFVGALLLALRDAQRLNPPAGNGPARAG